MIVPPISNIPITPGKEAIKKAQQAGEIMSQMNDEMKEQAAYDGIQGFITLAKIVSSLPVTGVYRIAAGKTILNSYAVCMHDTNNRVYGQKALTAYAPGTDVLVFITGDEADTLLPNVILGPVNTIALEPDTEHLFNKYPEFIPQSGVGALNRVDQHDQVLEENDEEMVSHDYSYGKPLDLLPGEWGHISPFGGGFFLSDFLTFMKASEMSKIECFLFDNSLRMKWEKFCSQNAAYDERIFYDRYGISRIRGLASTLSEGMGALNGLAALEDNVSSDPSSKQSRIWKVDDNQRGMFSQMHLEGYLVDGSYDFVSIPPTGETEYTDDADKVAPGLLSVEKRLDGTYKVKAAKELSLEKTVYIVAPKELADSDKADNSEETSFEREEWEDNHDPISDSAMLGRQVTDEYDEHDNTKNAFAGIHSKSAYWSLKSSKEEVYEAFNNATDAEFESEFKLTEMEEDDPHYTEPPREATLYPYANADGERNDPVKVFDVSTAIKQLEDGSIVISGGYGEEIKMYKGNIYLTCPGSIIEQPGKDKICLAPRHNIQKACKGTLELSSNNNAALVSAGNLQVVAGAEGTSGTLLLENKSQAPIDTEVYGEDGDMANNVPTAGGIVLKSQSTLAMLSKHNYIGYKGDEASSSITQINSANILTSARNHTSNVSGGSYTINNLGGSTLTLGSGVFEVLTSACNFGCGSALFTKASSDFSAYDYRGEITNVNINSGQPTIQCKGSGIFRSVLAVSGAIDGLSTTSGEVGKDPTGSGSSAHSKVPSSTGVLTTRTAVSTQGLFQNIIDAANGSLENLKKISTVLPKTAAYAVENFYMPISTWQAILQGGSTWREMTVPNQEGTTMPFPGQDKWIASGEGLKGYEDGKVVDKELNQEYIINTQL